MGLGFQGNYRVQGMGFRVQSIGFRAHFVGFRVKGSGFLSGSRTERPKIPLNPKP